MRVKLAGPSCRPSRQTSLDLARPLEPNFETALHIILCACTYRRIDRDQRLRIRRLVNWRGVNGAMRFAYCAPRSTATSARACRAERWAAPSAAAFAA